MGSRTFHAAWITDDGVEGTQGDALALFPLWSFGKTVLSLCALHLVEAGRLRLDDRLEGRTYTLRHLLQHTAGVPNYGRLTAYHEAVARGDPSWSRERLLATVGAQRSLFPPGTGWAYSNIGYMYVRELVEAAAGLPFGQIVRALSTSLDAPSIRLVSSTDEFAHVLWPAARTYDPGWVYHGCLVGSAVDAARMLRALARGRALGPDLLEQMLDCPAQHVSFTGRPWTTHGYGLGVMSGEMGAVGRAVGHSGAGPFSVNAVYHFPDAARPITVAVFTDGSDEGSAELEAARIGAGLSPTSAARE